MFPAPVIHKHNYNILYVHSITILYVHSMDGGWDSTVGIVTRYRLDGPGIESQWGQDLLHLIRPALGTKQPHIRWVPGLSRG
jgi:hypothetical protein